MFSLVGVEKRDHGCFFLWLSNGQENRLTVRFLEEIERAWAHAVRAGARCIVVSSQSRFFCNGVDLDETSKNPQIVLEKLVGVCRMILGSGVPSIGLLNGHAVGGGLLLALALDYRVAKKDKGGFFFVPAIELGIELPSWLLSLCVAKLGRPHATEILLSGARVSGQKALDWGMINVLVSAGEGLEETIALVGKVARDESKQVLHAKMKQTLFGDLLTKAKL